MVNRKQLIVYKDIKIDNACNLEEFMSKRNSSFSKKPLTLKRFIIRATLIAHQHTTLGYIQKI